MSTAAANFLFNLEAARNPMVWIIAGSAVAYLYKNNWRTNRIVNLRTISAVAAFGLVNHIVLIVAAIAYVAFRFRGSFGLRIANPLAGVSIRMPIQDKRRRIFTQEQRAFIAARDGNCCNYCGLDGNIYVMHVDHIVPFVAGGETEVWNGQLLCERHNLGKGSKSDAEARAIFGYPLYA